jgi:hypothetical protein
MFIFAISILNIVQSNVETIKMQTLASEIATTFADDAAALIKGCGRVIVQFLMAPIERIANACDVAGVLAARRSALRLPRVKTERARSRSNHARAQPARSGRRRHILSFHFLNDLT